MVDPSEAQEVIICGAGVSGSYLARLLEDEGFRVEVYDGNPLRGHRCAYGSFYSILRPSLMRAGLDIEDYITCWVDSLLLNGLELRVRNLVVIDKPRMLEGLYPSERVRRRFLRVPDELFRWERAGTLAVNASSIMLGAHRRIMARQYRARLSGLEARKAYLIIIPGYAGYAWAIPLDDRGYEFHLGAGSVNSDPHPLIYRLMERYGVRVEEISCACGRPISVADLERGGEAKICMRNIVSVGESAGAVYPATGEGIIPSIETSKWLYESLRRGRFPTDYLKGISKMLREYRDAFRLCVGFLRYPHLNWIRGAGRAAKLLADRAWPILTPRALIRLWLETPFKAGRGRHL